MEGARSSPTQRRVLPRSLRAAHGSGGSRGPETPGRLSSCTGGGEWPPHHSADLSSETGASGGFLVTGHLPKKVVTPTGLAKHSPK